MPSPALLAEYRLALEGLLRLTDQQLRSLLAGYDPTDAAGVVSALTHDLPDLAETYGDVSAVLSGDFYDTARAEAGIRARGGSVLASPAPRAQAEASARWATSTLFDSGTAEDLYRRASGSLARLVQQPGRDTIIDSAAAERVTVGYARQVAPGACRFCLMLAGRGAIYSSAASAYRSSGAGRMPDGARFHDDCHCYVVPIFGEQPLPEANRRLQETWQANRHLPIEQRLDALEGVAVPTTPLAIPG